MVPDPKQLKNNENVCRIALLYYAMSLKLMFFMISILQNDNLKHVCYYRTRQSETRLMF